MQSLKQVLFELPWWVAGVLLIAAVLLCLFALARQQKTLLKVAAVLVGVMTIWLVLTLTITTHREAAIARTNTIVEAYDNDDWATLGNEIDELTAFNGWLMGDQIVDAARSTKPTLRQTEVRITKIESAEDAAGIRVDIDVISVIDGPVSRLPTSWRFEYVVRDGTLFLSKIDPLPNDYLQVDDVIDRVQSPIPAPVRRTPSVARRPSFQASVAALALPA